MFDIGAAASATQYLSDSPALKAAQLTRNNFEIRCKNLRTLVKIHGGQSALAKKLGLKKGAYISQILSQHPTRTLSEKTTRKWETKLKLPDGWLSNPANTPLGMSIKGSLSENLVLAVVATLKEVNIALSQSQVASLAIRLNSSIEDLVRVTK